MEKNKLSKALKTMRDSFFENDFRELDRTLSIEQQNEWNAIYASFRSESLMRGTVIGLDEIALPIRDEETGDIVSSTMRCLVVVTYRVKVLIPEPFIWADNAEREPFVMNGMIGANIDFIIAAVDRQGECALASREAAMRQQRWHTNQVRHIAPGDIVRCDVLSVGPHRLTLSACGYDATLAQRNLSYCYLDDLRIDYHSGQVLDAKVLEISADEISLSVRDAALNPYEGAELRHPGGSTRLAVITSKYAGGVFARLPDGCTVVCKYAQHFSDDQFQTGDRIIVQVDSFNDERQWIRAKIRGKA